MADFVPPTLCLAANSQLVVNFSGRAKHSFKGQIQVNGNQAYLYFECIDIGNFDTSPVVVGALFLGGTVRNMRGKWLFSDMTGGSASPLSVDHYYFP